MASVPEAREQEPILRYANAAVAIHWLTVVLVLTQVWLGFTFHDLPRGPERMELFTWHKTVGATILLLTIVRLIVRLKNPPPPFPPELPRWERLAAVWNHRIFYVLLIALPLTGLIAVSGRADDWFTPLVGGVPLPVVPGIDEPTGELSGGVHEVLVYPILERIVNWRSPEIRALFESYQLTVHEWEKARTDRVTLRAIALPGVESVTAAAR